MSAWLSEWGPLTGPLCGIVFVAAFVAGNNSTPDDNATGQQVIHTMLWVLVAGIWLTLQGPPAIRREAAAEDRVPSLT